MRYAEQYISKGVSLWIVGRLVITLLPYLPGAHDSRCPCCWRCSSRSAGCPRTGSSSRLQACGVSLYGSSGRVALASVTSCLATAYVYMVLIPVGNQTFREITFNIVASSAENEVKPRVFFDGFPNVVVYARELPPSGGWDGVFIADNRAGEGSSVYLARHGRAVVNRTAKTVEMVLEDWTQHEVDATGQYRVFRGEQPRAQPQSRRHVPGRRHRQGTARDVSSRAAARGSPRCAPRAPHRTTRSSSFTSALRFRRHASSSG